MVNHRHELAAATVTPSDTEPHLAALSPTVHSPQSFCCHVPPGRPPNNASTASVFSRLTSGRDFSGAGLHEVVANPTGTTC